MATQKNWAAIRKINKNRKAKRLREMQDLVASYIRTRGSTPTASQVRLYELICGMTKEEKIKGLRDGKLSFSLVSDAALWRKGLI